jgi:hypothetical protein
MGAVLKCWLKLEIKSSLNLILAVCPYAPAESSLAIREGCVSTVILKPGIPKITFVMTDILMLIEVLFENK